MDTHGQTHPPLDRYRQMDTQTYTETHRLTYRNTNIDRHTQTDAETEGHMDIHRDTCTTPSGTAIATCTRAGTGSHKGTPGQKDRQTWTQIHRFTKTRACAWGHRHTETDTYMDMHTGIE